MVILSASFSIDSVSSWIGFYGRFSDSAIGLLVMCLAYFLVVNNIRYRKSETEDQMSEIGEGITEEPKSKIQSSKSRQPGISVTGIISLILASGWIATVTAYLSIFTSPYSYPACLWGQC